MPVKYEVAASTGTYTDKNGQEKRRWTKCGVVMETDKGLSLKLEVIPVESNGWFSLFEPKERSEQPVELSNKTLAEVEDDIPF